jgi:hypothetical protein
MIYGYNIEENYRGEETNHGKMNRKNFEQFLKSYNVSDEEIKEFLAELNPSIGTETLYIKPNWTIDANVFEISQYGQILQKKNDEIIERNWINAV